MTENLTNITIEVSSEVVAEIDAEAHKFGLQRSSYLLALHAIHCGSIDPSLLSSVREIFTHDRDILRELAK